MKALGYSTKIKSEGEGKFVEKLFKSKQARESGDFA